MSAAFEEAWDTIEERIFEYLVDATDSIEGVNAFRLEDRPRALVQTGADAAEWSFNLSGGPITNPRQTRQQQPHGVWEMDGEVSVRGTCARTVRRFASRLFGVLPCGPGDVPDLARCYATGNPEIERILQPSGDADDAMREIIVFYARIPVHAVFQNPTPANPEP